MVHLTNAEYIEAIGARCSRRTYSHTPPDPRVLEILQEMVDAVNRQSGLSLVIFYFVRMFMRGIVEL